MSHAARILPSIVPAAAAALMLAATPAMAFRCGTKLISEGDPVALVRQYCGAPVTVEQHLAFRSGIARAPHAFGTGDIPVQDTLLIPLRALEEVVVETWTYNLGPHRLMPRIRFEDGRVAQIEWLGYGYPDE